MASLKFISVNARGLNSKEKREKFYNWISDSKFDVIFLQETHFVEKYLFQYDCVWSGKTVHCFSDSALSRGVSILFRKGLEYDILSILKTNEARKLMINLNISNITYSLVNIYAPYKDNNRIELFKGIRKFILNNSISNNFSNIILCGDFNCHMDSVKTDKSSKILEDICRQLELKDLWKEKHSKLQGNIWCDTNNIPKSRIDFIFLSESTVSKIKKISPKKIPGTHNKGTRMSDHKREGKRILETKYKTFRM